MSKDNTTATDQTTADDLDIELSVEELKAMLLERTQELLDAQTALKALEIRSIAVFKENELLKASPSIAEQQAQMDFYLKLAKTFIAAGAFKVKTAEEAYVIMAAGKEMGLKPIESMMALYIVKGSVRYYGDKMIGKLTQLGFKITYTNESKNGVTVTVGHPDSEFIYQEQVRSDEDILMKSEAMKFAPKNKMRFHGVRMVASFYLPHLFMSVSDQFSADFEDWKNKDNMLNPGDNTLSITAAAELPLVTEINECKNMEQLDALFEEKKAQISRNIKAMSAVGQMRKKFQSEKP